MVHTTKWKWWDATVKCMPVFPLNTEGAPAMYKYLGFDTFNPTTCGRMGLGGKHVRSTGRLAVPWESGGQWFFKKVSDGFPRKFQLDFHESIRWISMKVSDGFPTWKVLAPVPQHLCLSLSPMCLASWIKLWAFHYDHNHHISKFRALFYLKVRRSSSCALSAEQ